MFEKGNSGLISTGLRDRIANLLAVLDAAGRPADMALPGYRLHELQGGQKGVWSATVSGNWRITFRFPGGNAVDVDLFNYH